MRDVISFVIPAFNEQKHIGATISSIKKFLPSCFDVEIIVIDNESVDETGSLALSAGAKVLKVAGGPISKLRNYGVSQSHGEIIVFLDADVYLTEFWSESIEGAVRSIQKDYRLITGSHCHPPENAVSIYEKYWFSSFEKSRSSHLGTGHLIMSRRLFDEIGGFSESLETGEDHEICSRAKRFGAVIQEREALKVVHNDFPQTLLSFMYREAWHGKSDWISIKRVLHSKVAMASLGFLFLHLFLVSGLFIESYQVSILGVLSICVFLLSISVVKFKHKSVAHVFINAWIYYFYFWGRLVAGLRVFIEAFMGARSEGKG